MEAKPVGWHFEVDNQKNAPWSCHPESVVKSLTKYEEK